MTLSINFTLSLVAAQSASRPVKIEDLLTFLLLYVLVAVVVTVILQRVWVIYLATLMALIIFPLLVAGVII